jgi:hypothetical protein
MGQYDRALIELLKLNRTAHTHALIAPDDEPGFRMHVDDLAAQIYQCTGNFSAARQLYEANYV